MIFEFLLTFVLEFLIFWAFFRKNVLKIAGYCFLINLFTWPLANIAYDFYSSLLVIELGVVLVESLLIMLLFKANYWKSITVAFLANLVSFFVGLFVTKFI